MGVDFGKGFQVVFYLRQFLNCVEEFYIHGFQKGGAIDETYADWFIDLLDG